MRKHRHHLFLTTGFSMLTAIVFASMVYQQTSCIAQKFAGPPSGPGFTNRIAKVEASPASVDRIERNSD